jgi:hypothetical protein
LFLQTCSQFYLVLVIYNKPLIFFTVETKLNNN